MKHKINKEILARYVEGNFTVEDQKYIDKIFVEEDYKSGLEELMKSDWNQFNSKTASDFKEKDLSPILYKLYYKFGKDQSTVKTHRIMNFWSIYSKVAATILFPLALAFGLYSQLEVAENVNQESYAEIHAPMGSRVSFVLPDGSSGWLNSGSTLKYPVHFGETRDVDLKGEAYFDIKKDESKSFTVYTQELNISVLGTQFNVCAYEDEKNVDVVLESGKIQLYHNGMKGSIEMVPDERVVFDAGQKAIQKSKVISAKYSSWKDGKLIFKDDPLDEVINRLSRWYNVEITLKKNVKSDLKLRATFIDEDIEEVLRLIKLTYPIEYELLPREKDSNGNFKKRKIKLEVA